MPPETIIVILGVATVFAFFSLFLEWASRHY
jgi:hypothetical protein